MFPVRDAFKPRLGVLTFETGAKNGENGTFFGNFSTNVDIL